MAARVAAKPGRDEASHPGFGCGIRHTDGDNDGIVAVEHVGELFGGGAIGDMGDVDGVGVFGCGR